MASNSEWSITELLNYAISSLFYKKNLIYINKYIVFAKKVVLIPSKGFAIFNAFQIGSLIITYYG
jgi:hypothetical protein